MRIIIFKMKASNCVFKVWKLISHSAFLVNDKLKFTICVYFYQHARVNSYDVIGLYLSEKHHITYNNLKMCNSTKALFT